MSITGSYNGVSIIALPSYPAPKQIQLEMNTNVAAPVNPYTGATQQVLAWQGGDWWTAQIAMPQLRSGEEVGIWQGFLAECRGKLNVFMLGDSSYTFPRGTAKGQPVVNGAQPPMATTLNTKGWAVNSYRLLLPGDYLQIGLRLHRVLDTVNSDANGDATISIFPSLRDALTDGEQIILNSPKGLFRMQDNKQSMLIDVSHMGGCSFNVVEAR